MHGCTHSRAPGRLRRLLPPARVESRTNVRQHLRKQMAVHEATTVRDRRCVPRSSSSLLVNASAPGSPPRDRHPSTPSPHICNAEESEDRSTVGCEKKGQIISSTKGRGRRAGSGISEASASGFHGRKFHLAELGKSFWTRLYSD